MKLKSILIIAATLIIGFIIGFLVNGQLTRKKFERFVHQGSYDAFKIRMMKVIDPDASQVKEIEPILEEYAVKAHQSIENSKNEMKVLHEEMMEELKPYLNEYQIKRLNRMHDRFKKVWDRDRGSPPPPHGRRPGRDRH